MKKIVVLFIIIFIWIIPDLSGQGNQKKMTMYSVEDGLSQSSVHSMIQDGFGYLWISTANGLNCFDGKDITCYFPPVGPGSSYNVNRIRKTLCDEIGNLWIGTDEGLFFFNRITNEIEDPFPEIKEIKSGYCYPLFLVNDTIHALTSDSSVLSINLHDHQFRTTHFESAFYWIISTTDNFEEIVGISATSSIVFFGIKSSALSIQTFKFDIQLFGNLSDIKFYKKNKYFILFHDEILLFNRDSGTLEPPLETHIPHEKGKSIFKSLKQLKSGEVWIGSSNQGIFVLDSTLTYRYQISGEADHKLPVRNISTIFEDKQSNIWIGTDGYGLGLLKPDNTGPGLVNHESSTIGNLSSDFIWSFYEDDERMLWIGTANEGINKWNRKSNTIENYLLSNKKTFPTPNDIYSICPLGEDELLIGTSCGIWLFDKKTHLSYPISNLFNDQNIRRTTSIIPIEKNQFIAQIQNRCFIISENEKSWMFDTIQIPDSVIINLTYKSVTGNIFGFTGDGIYKITGGEIDFTPFIYRSGRMMIKINSIAELTNGFIYAATDKGLVVLDFNGQITRIYSTSDGLPNHYLYGILADRNENLWISSNRGLSHFNPVSEKFDNYGMTDGLQSFEFNSGATFKNDAGEMFFGGINGFNYFHPDSLHSLKFPPTVEITGLKVNDLAYKADSSMMAKKLVSFEYSLNTITFEFKAIEFTNPEYIIYSCFLEGYDKNWVDAGPSNFIRYSKLPPGKYKFSVKAAGRQGNWGQSPAEINLVIDRPIWMKSWFIIAMTFLAIGIVVVTVYYLSTVKIRKKIAILEHQREISLIHTRISSDLHDDIGSGLSKLAMLSDTAILNLTDHPEGVKRLKNISANARRLIDQLRVIVWTLNPQYDQLESLISYIHQQAGDFLDNFPIKVTFTLPEKIPSVSVSPEFKRNIHYTVMEALHNAVKHSGSEEIFIDLKVHENRLEISVRDTGTGFDPTQVSGFGNGLHFIQKRMEDIKGTFTINSQKGKGTIIHITADL
jgi:ligand-binding sensor domain-containing protein